MSPRILGPGSFFPYDADHKDLRRLFDKQSADVATIRAYGAKFGKGVAVEPGITNVQPQNDFNTLLGGFNSTDGHRPQDVITLVDGWRRVPKSGPLVVNSEVIVQATYVISAGQRYTEQFLFRSNAYGWPTFDITFFTNNGHHLVAPTLTHLGKGVWHAMATYVIETGGTALRAINLAINSWGPATFIDLTEPIVHLHAGVQSTVTEPIRASHVWGTRADGILKYPGWLLPRREGTISCWMRPNYDFKNFAAADYHGLVTSTTTHVSDQMQFWILGETGAPLGWDVYVGAAAQINMRFLPTDWSPKRLHHVAVSWSDVEQVLYYDGVRRTTRSGNFSRWNEATWVTVGTASAPSTPNDWLDGLIDDVAIFPRQLSDARIAAIHA